MKGAGSNSVPGTVPTLGQLATPRGIDEELQWFFDADDGVALPSNYGRMLSPVSEDGERRMQEDYALAARRHCIIRSMLNSLSDHDAGVLQCAYDPRAWPRRLERKFGRLTGVVVRLFSNRRTWPEARAEQLATDAVNAETLTTMLRAGGHENDRILYRLKWKAEAELVAALGNYEVVRRGRLLSRVP